MAKNLIYLILFLFCSCNLSNEKAQKVTEVKIICDGVDVWDDELEDFGFNSVSKPLSFHLDGKILGTFKDVNESFDGIEVKANVQRFEGKEISFFPKSASGRAMNSPRGIWYDFLLKGENLNFELSVSVSGYSSYRLDGRSYPLTCEIL